MSQVTAARPLPLPVRAGAAGIKDGFAVQASSILFDLGSDPQKSLPIKSRSLPSGWGLIQDPECVADPGFVDAGWNWFFLAGEMTVTAVGFDRSNALQAALSRLLRRVKAQKCNSFEVARVIESSFLGIPQVGVCGHVRHLQKGRLLFG
jgi:hypothetical protein